MVQICFATSWNLFLFGAFAVAAAAAAAAAATASASAADLDLGGSPGRRTTSSVAALLISAPPASCRLFLSTKAIDSQESRAGWMHGSVDEACHDKPKPFGLHL